MISNKALKISVIVLVLLNIASLVFIWSLHFNPNQRHIRNEYRPERAMRRLARELDLSKEQQSSMRAIHREFRKKERTLQKNLMQERSEMKNRLFESQDTSEIKSSLKSISKLEYEMELLKYQKHMALMKFLNTDQKIKFESLMERSIQRHHRR